MTHMEPKRRHRVVRADEGSLHRTVADYLVRCTETLVSVLLSLLGLGAMRSAESMPL